MATSDIQTITTHGLHWHTCTSTSANVTRDDFQSGVFLHMTGDYRMEGEYFDSAVFSRKGTAESYAEVQQTRAQMRGLVAQTIITPCVSQCAIYPHN